MGKMNKFYSENCLLQQEFVRGDVFTGTVEQYLADAAKKLGGKITFVDAIRFEKGEGIEKKAGELRRGDRQDGQGLIGLYRISL